MLRFILYCNKTIHPHIAHKDRNFLLSIKQRQEHHLNCFACKINQGWIYLPSKESQTNMHQYTANPLNVFHHIHHAWQYAHSGPEITCSEKQYWQCRGKRINQIEINPSVQSRHNGRRTASGALKLRRPHSVAESGARTKGRWAVFNSLCICHNVSGEKRVLSTSPRNVKNFAVAVFTCHCTIITAYAMDMNDEKRWGVLLLY